MKIFIDTIDVSELLLDIKYESDLSGSSRSSIFGSIETEQLELVVKNKHDGERLYIDDEEYAITECDYDEKSERTTVKAITDLRALDDEFELVGKEENVIEEHVSFKDFKITGNKPNLIPNGWDSFEPYGSGISLFKQWNFDKVTEIDDTEWNGVYSKAELSNDVLKTTYTGSPNVLSRFFPQNQRIEPDIHYILRVKMRNPYWDVHMFSGSLRWINADLVGYRIPKSNDFTIHEIEVVGTNDQNRVHFYFDHSRFPQEVNIGEYFEIAWLSLTPVDNQHLVVEKTPLENGLTRIQTWGGNSYIKLQTKTQLPNVGKYNISTYAKCDKGFFIGGNDGREFNEIIQSGFNEIQREATNRNITINVRTGVFDKELDFVASDPQIVEGDVPNAVMTVDTLPDGKEEVNIYGARNDTELVYKADAVTGAPYELYGNIENLGRELKLSSTLGDSDIKKGENQVNLEGDAKNREVAIKIGVA